MRGATTTKYTLPLHLLLLLLFFFFFFFCFFGHRKWRKGVGEKWQSVAASGRTVVASLRGRRRGSLRLLISNPKRHHFGLVFCFLKNQNTPKRRRFGVFIFFFFLKTPKTTSFWASSNQNGVVLCIWTLSLKKTLSYSDCTLKSS